MKNSFIKVIRNLLQKIFTSKINFKRLYSTAWNKEKSNYLRDKIKGKKHIRWDEKKGKGGYFDNQLRYFNKNLLQSEMADIDFAEVKEGNIKEPSHLKEEEVPYQLGMWFPFPLKEVKIPNGMEFTEEDLIPLRKVMNKDEAIQVWKEIIENKSKNPKP